MNKVYLNIGSNINAESNLPKAIALLRQHGEVSAVSKAYESKAVGFEGDNFLNACVLFLTPLAPDEIKNKILTPIENQLGRVRTENKFSPRSMDIDIVLFNGEILAKSTWNQAFVICPLAELLPEFDDPLNGEKLSRRAEQLRDEVWIVPRGDVKFF